MLPRAYGSSVVASPTPPKAPKVLPAYPSQPPLQGWVGGDSVSETRVLPGWRGSRMAVRVGPRLESRHDPARPVDSQVKGMSSNVKTVRPVRTHPRYATLGGSTFAAWWRERWSARTPRVNSDTA